MGCDIHAYVEYKPKGNTNWQSFGKRLNPGRYYGMFALLANVRNNGDLKPVAELRGVPLDVGYYAAKDLVLRVNDKFGNEEGWCSKASADRWVAGGSSKWWVAGHSITHPDWHSHSWVTADELQKALGSLPFENPYEYVAVLDCLRSFERQGCEGRLVFWFDN